MQEPTGADVKASTEEPGKEEKPTEASLKSRWGSKGNKGIGSL